MRYTVLELSNKNEPGLKLNMRNSILKTYHYFDDAFDFIDKWHYKTAKEMKELDGKVSCQIFTKENIKSRIDMGENVVCVSNIKSGSKSEKIFIQAIE